MSHFNARIEKIEEEIRVNYKELKERDTHIQSEFELAINKFERMQSQNPSSVPSNSSDVQGTLRDIDNQLRNFQKQVNEVRAGQSESVVKADFEMVSKSITEFDNKLTNTSKLLRELTNRIDGMDQDIVTISKKPVPVGVKGEVDISQYDFVDSSTVKKLMSDESTRLKQDQDNKAKVLDDKIKQLNGYIEKTFENLKKQCTDLDKAVVGK
jgi:Zn-dependent oligopeptidase